MKLRILTWMLIGHLAGGVLYAAPKHFRQPKPRYHCMCGEICTKAAPGERCELKRCNGKDVRRIKAGERNPK